MKKILTLVLALSIWSCDDDSIATNNLDLDDLKSCFSPEFGITEDEQFFYDVELGELEVNLDNEITTINLGYSLQEGSKLVFVYRQFLENSFNVIDDEAEIRILFQIDENLTEFSINSLEDFEKSNCIYAECGVALQSISGSIIGNKNSAGNWSIEAELQVDRFTQLKEIFINEIFVF